MAVSADGQGWFLLNASPDVLSQTRANPQLWPRNLRDSPIRGVVLTNGDLDHVLGLLQLRESQPLTLYATERVLAGLRENAALRTLERFEGQLRRHALRLDETRELEGADGVPSGVFVTAEAVAGKPPLHLVGLYEPSIEDNVALRVRSAKSGTLVYASAIADAGKALPLFQGSAALLLDGTFWSEDELPDLGVPMGPARTMAHQPVGGLAGSLHALRTLDVPRRIFTHVNNTNPLLEEGSPARAQVEAQGWEVATDGLLVRVD